MHENQTTNPSEEEVEIRIREAGKIAPRIRPTDLDKELDPTVPPQYYRFPGTTVTVCCLTTLSGYTVVGSSAAVSMKNFDEEIGREVAAKDARRKLWPLLGFRLSCDLAKKRTI